MAETFSKSVLSEIGQLSRFAGQFFSQWFKPRYEVNEFFRQCYIIGYNSFPLVALTGFIMGLVITSP